MVAEPRPSWSPVALLLLLLLLAVSDNTHRVVADHGYDAPVLAGGGRLGHSQALDDYTEDLAQMSRRSCGFASALGEALIIHGHKTSASEFPWHVGLFVPTHRQWTNVCGGSLVHPRVVVTAAHCMFKEAGGGVMEPGNMKVAIASALKEWSATSTEVQHRNVSRLIPHPRYRGRGRNYADDIGLIELEKAVIVNAYVVPICVDWRGSDGPLLSPGTIGKVVGWGVTADGKPSSTLQSAALPLVTFEKCADEVPMTFLPFLTSDKFCAGYVNGSTVSNGDSGGGLAFEHRGLWFLKGVVSVGVPSQLSYSAFTNVTAYTGWISSVIRGVERRQQAEQEQQQQHQQKRTTTSTRGPGPRPTAPTTSSSPTSSSRPVWSSNQEATTEEHTSWSNPSMGMGSMGMPSGSGGGAWSSGVNAPGNGGAWSSGVIPTGGGGAWSSGVKGGCRKHGDCKADRACMQGQCLNPCDCGEHAECTVTNHEAVCRCPFSYEGDAKVACKHSAVWPRDVPAGATKVLSERQWGFFAYGAEDGVYLKRFSNGHVEKLPGPTARVTSALIARHDEHSTLYYAYFTERRAPGQYAYYSWKDGELWAKHVANLPPDAELESVNVAHSPIVWTSRATGTTWHLTVGDLAAELYSKHSDADF